MRLIIYTCIFIARDLGIYVCDSDVFIGQTMLRENQEKLFYRAERFEVGRDVVMPMLY